MQPRKHLHPKANANGTSTARFMWLSAPGAAGLSLLFLQADSEKLHNIFGGSLTKLTDIPQRVWLKDASGETIDEAMGCIEHDGVLLTCHGGPGVRRALEAELDANNFQPDTEHSFGNNYFQRQTVGLLQSAHGESAVRLVLEASHQRESLQRALHSPNDLPAMLSVTAGVPFLFSPPRVQLWGAVNAGKSSLLNALCGRTLAGVGSEPGLTRDVIEGRLIHDGFELRIFDAPGTWAGHTDLDASAIELALRWRNEADLILELVPPGAKGELDNAWNIPSQADEPDAEGVSVKRPESLKTLKDRLIDHFFGQLRNLPPAQRFALHPELRQHLATCAEDPVASAGLIKRWLD